MADEYSDIIEKADFSGIPKNSELDPFRGIEKKRPELTWGRALSIPGEALKGTARAYARSARTHFEYGGWEEFVSSAEIDLGGLDRVLQIYAQEHPQVSAWAQELIDQHGMDEREAVTTAARKHYEERQKRISQTISDIEQSEFLESAPEFRGRSSGFLEDIGMAGFGTLPSMGALVLSPWIGVPTIYMHMQGALHQEIEAEAQARGIDVSKEKIAKLSMMGAFIATPMELIGELAQIRAIMGTGKWTKHFLQLALVWGGEAFTEYAQKHPEEVAVRMALNPDLNAEEIMDLVWETVTDPEVQAKALYEGAVGGFTGLTFAGVGKMTRGGIDALISPKQKRINEQKRKAIKEYMQNDNLSAEQQREFLKTVGIDPTEITEAEISNIVEKVKDRILFQAEPIKSPEKDQIVNEVIKAGKLKKEDIDLQLAIWDGIARVATEKGLIKKPEDFYTEWISEVRASRAAEFTGEGQFQAAAFHGSPYLFDKFSTQKIGTGEGAQAFGWGLYFTESEGIARDYAKSLADQPLSFPYIEINGKPIDDKDFTNWLFSFIPHGPSTEYIIAEGTHTLEFAKREWQKAFEEANSEIEELKQIAKEGKKTRIEQALKIFEEDRNEYKKRVDYAKRAIGLLNDPDIETIEAGWREAPGGRQIYKVTLHKGKDPDQYEWLDWYEKIPLNTLEKIKKNFKPDIPKKIKIGDELPTRWDDKTVNWFFNDIAIDLDDYIINHPHLNDYDLFGQYIDTNNEVSYDEFVELSDSEKLEYGNIFRDEYEKELTTGEELYKRLSSFLGSDKAASEFLLRAGIDGIRYPSGTLSGVKESKYNNYVIFDENAVTIEERVAFQGRIPDQISPLDKRKPSDIELAQKGVTNEIQTSEDQTSLSETDRPDPRKTSATEALEQVQALNYARFPEQNIVTIKEAQDWLASHNYPRIVSAGEQSKTIERLIQDVEFQKLNIFDKIRIAAQLERPLRKRDYSSLSRPESNRKLSGAGIRKGQNRKVSGSNIVAADTVVGCDHFCFECYALKGSSQRTISHQHPVLRKLGGILYTGEKLRIGEAGDPSKNWGHTHEQIKGLLERSKKRGNKVTASQNVFYITKLLNLRGFNPTTARNLQVTLDPMYPAHMWRSMENILRLKAAHPEVAIAARIRSFATHNKDLNESQQAALDFAKRFKMPILETRMRFMRKSSFDLLELDESKYKYTNHQYKLKKPQYKQEEENQEVRLCDKGEKGCPACKNCTTLTNARSRINRIQNEVISNEGIDGISLKESEVFDPTGGALIYQQKRGAIQHLFGKMPKIIHLFESADPSTLIHETGHILLEMIYRAGDADYLKAAKWAGVEEERARQGTDKWTDAELEKFAKAFEKYMMEGRAPTLGLAKVFDRIRTALLEIYKHIRNEYFRDVKLTDDMRSLFDRWIETENMRRTDPFFEVADWYRAEDVSLSESDIIRQEIENWKRNPESAFSLEYDEIVEKARRMVAGRLAEKKVKLEKELEKSFRQEAEESIEQDPFYTMIDEILASGGLKLETVSKMYDKGMILDLQRRRPGILAKDGFPPDVLGEQYGYDSIDEMLQDLLYRPGKKEAIESYYNSLWKGYEAVEHLNKADTYIEAMEVEIDLINELMGRKKPKIRHDLKKIIRQRTRQEKGEDSRKLRDDLNRDAQVAREAWRARNKEILSLKEKHLERVKNIRNQYKERAKKETIHKRMNRIVRQKTMIPEFKAHIVNFLSRYYRIPKSIVRDLPGESLPEFLAVLEAEGEQISAVLQYYDKAPPARSKGKLSLEEVEVIGNVVTGLAHLERAQRKQTLYEHKKALQDIVNANNKVIFDTRKPNGELKHPIEAGRDPNWFGRMSESSKTFFAELHQPEFIFWNLDGYEDFGPNWTSIFGGIKKAEDAEFVLGEEYLAKYQELWSGFDRAWALKKYEITGLPLMTKEEMILTVLGSGNEYNRIALKNGNGINEQQIDEIIDLLSDKEIELVHKIWDLIDSLYPKLNAVHKKLTGVNLEKVEGKYFPLVYNPKLSYFAAKYEAEKKYKSLLANEYIRPTVEAGHRIARKEFKNKPAVKLTFDVIQNHLLDVIHDITHQIPVRDAQKIIHHPDYRETIRNVIGPEIYAQLPKWIAHVANPRIDPGTELERVLGRLRRNATTVALGLKVSVAAKQLLSLTQTMDQIGVVPTVKGMEEFLKNPWAAKRFVDERSPSMRNRRKTWDRELAQFYPSFSPKDFKGQAWMRDAYFSLISLNDVIATYSTWLAGYQYELKRNGFNEPRAIEFADMLARRTQPSARPKDLAEIQRGGELKKMLTMFYTFFAKFQNMMMAAHGKMRLGKINMAQLARSYWFLMVAPAILGVAISDREWPKDWKTLVKAIISYRIGGIPFFRDAVQAMVTGYEYTFSPAVGGVTESARLYQAATADDPEVQRIVKRLVMLSGYIFGLPAAQATILMDGIIDMVEGKTSDPTRLVFRKKKSEKKKFRGLTK